MFLSHYPLEVLRQGKVPDQYGEKKQEQVIKSIISQLQVTSEPYKCLDLLSQLQPVLKPPSGNQHLTRLSQLSLPAFPVHTAHIPVLDMPATVSLTAHSNSLTLNLAVTGQLYLPFPTKNCTTHWASL